MAKCSILFVIVCLLVSCSEGNRSQPSEYLGGVQSQFTGMLKPNSETLNSPSLVNDASVEGFEKAINELAQKKKLLGVEKLCRQARVKFPSEPLFKILHARALLDIGRSQDTARILGEFRANQVYEADVKFLQSIVDLSVIQSAQFRGEEALEAFVNASRNLFTLSRSHPNYKDRFPPHTTASEVRQTLVRYGDRLPLEQLDISRFKDAQSMIGTCDLLERMNRSTLSTRLLKAAQKKWSENKSLSIL